MRESEGLRTDVMMTSTGISRAGWIVALLLAFGLAGCGSSADSASHAGVAKYNKNLHGQPSADPASPPPETMVAGVSPSKAGPPIGLKFNLREPPQAGQMLDVDVALLPDAPAINRIFAKFRAGEGLDLVEGGEMAAVEKPATGTVIRHVVRVLPKQDGIFTVSATVSVELADDSIMRTYTIPVIVGDGFPEDARKTEVAEGPAHPGSADPSGALKTH
jgi:hypothetical protein